MSEPDVIGTEATAGEPPETTDPPERARLRAIARIAHALDPSNKQGELSLGDAAALRRLDPAQGLSPAFFRVVADILEPAGQLEDGRLRDEIERRWAAIVRVMAILGGLHARRMRLGAALADSGYSDLRFERLLRAHGEGLWDEARRAAHYLASKAQPSDHADFAHLILSNGLDHGESVRRRLARDFYRARRRAQTTTD